MELWRTTDRKDTVGMNNRGCYCDIWEKDPEFFRKQGIPEGFCGFCDTCKKPGHTRHFPGSSPYTGTWCDFHYRMIGLIHPLGIYGTFFWAAIVILLIVVWKILSGLLL